MKPFEKRHGSLFACLQSALLHLHPDSYVFIPDFPRDGYQIRNSLHNSLFNLLNKLRALRTWAEEKGNMELLAKLNEPFEFGADAITPGAPIGANKQK